MGEVQRFTNCTTGGPVFVDVKDGKIIRLTPLEFDDTDAPSWTIEARGQKFTPPRKALVSPWTIAHRSTVYSPKRILTPLKRVDFDPKGDRNIQNRGTSGYEPISWDEAFDMVAEEIIRVKREYGPCAIYTQPSSHQMWGNVGYRFSCYQRFLNAVGMTYIEAADSWEGWLWGGAHMWGNTHRLGNLEGYDLLEDALQNTEMIVFWSSDPDTTQVGVYAAYESQPRRRWLKDLGVKMVFIDPYFNHTAGMIGDKWLAPRPGTDVPVALAIAFTWLTEGTYDKEYVASKTVGFDSGKTTSSARPTANRRPPNGRRPNPACSPATSALWRASGPPRRPCWPPAGWPVWAARHAARRGTSGPAP
jgi:trimethylamine-N-oxide reductase (cytochrome c)